MEFGSSSARFLPAFIAVGLSKTPTRISTHNYIIKIQSTETNTLHTINTHSPLFTNSKLIPIGSSPSLEVATTLEAEEEYKIK